MLQPAGRTARVKILPETKIPGCLTFLLSWLCRAAPSNFSPIRSFRAPTSSLFNWSEVGTAADVWLRGHCGNSCLGTRLDLSCPRAPLAAAAHMDSRSRARSRRYSTPAMIRPFSVRPDMAAVSASHVSGRRNTRANAEAFMKTRTIASALGFLAAAALLVADGAHAGRSGDHHGDGAARAGGFHGSAWPGWHGGRTRWVGGRSYPGTYDRAGDYYGNYYGRWTAADAARVAAKAAARAAYDAHDPDFLHRCYQPQRIWNGAYYTWRLVSVC